MTDNVLITGSNRGIGLALTQYFKAKGDNVFAVCRQSSEALNKLNVNVIDGIDVVNSESLLRLNEKIGQTKINILINNAGILRSMSFDTLNYADIQSQFEVNAVAPLKVVEALKNNFCEGSKIAMITSRMGSIEDNTSGGTYGYRMSKAALNAAGKSLAIDLKPKGVAVALLHPGYVKTDMTNHSGQISVTESAESLAARVEQLNLDNSGSFWHSNGELLPW